MMNYAPLNLFYTRTNSMRPLISIIESRTSQAPQRGTGLSFPPTRPDIGVAVINPPLRPIERRSSRWSTSIHRLLAS